MDVVLTLLQKRRLPEFLNSLRLTAENLLGRHGYELVVMLEHPDADDQALKGAVLGVYGNTRFREIDLSPPPEIAGTSGDWVERDRFSAGYRGMCDYYSSGIWDDYHQLDYIMRLDDDSVITTPVEHCLFDRVRQSGSDYGFRAYWYGADDPYITGLPELLEIPKSKRIIYNNLFVARTGFFTGEAVQSDLRKIRESRGIYTGRWGDSPIHDYLLRKHGAKVMRFDDFGYIHRREWLPGKAMPESHSPLEVNAGDFR